MWSYQTGKFFSQPFDALPHFCLQPWKLSWILFLQGNIDIREDLDEAELERWRRDRREKVREAKISEKQEQKGWAIIIQVDFQKL